MNESTALLASRVKPLHLEREFSPFNEIFAPYLEIWPCEWPLALLATLSDSDSRAIASAQTKPIV